MGTRGTIHIIFNGKKLVLYKHFDSYLEGLGENLILELIELLEEYNIEELKKVFSEIKFVYDDDNQHYQKPTKEQIEKLEKYTDLLVDSQSTNNWYCLLHGTQGSLKKTIDAGYALCVSGLEEYNYTIDLDNETFKCHKGSGKIIWNTKLGIDHLKNFVQTKIGNFDNWCKSKTEQREHWEKFMLESKERRKTIANIKGEK